MNNLPRFRQTRNWKESRKRLAETWLEIRKVAPQLPESSDAGEPDHQIELLQGAWSQLAIRVEHLEVQL
jgi:hypothetical protein